MLTNPTGTPATRSLAASLYRQLRRDGFGPEQVRALAEQLSLLAEAQGDALRHAPHEHAGPLGGSRAA